MQISTFSKTPAIKRSICHSGAQATLPDEKPLSTRASPMPPNRPSAFPRHVTALIGSLMLASATGQPIGANPFPGNWSGAAQFQLNVGGKVDAAAHSVSDLALTLDPKGRVVGNAPENGCRFLGITTPGTTVQMINLDVTLSACRYPAFNRRFNGTIIWSPNSQTGVLNLSSNQIGLGKAEIYDIKATLKK